MIFLTIEKGEGAEQEQAETGGGGFHTRRVSKYPAPSP